MIAVNCFAPFIPMLEMVKVPPCNITDVNKFFTSHLPGIHQELVFLPLPFL